MKGGGNSPRDKLEGIGKKEEREKRPMDAKGRSPMHNSRTNPTSTQTEKGEQRFLPRGRVTEALVNKGEGGALKLRVG